MEIGSSEVFKFCARKMIKKTSSMFAFKTINLFQNVVTDFSLKNVSCMVRAIPQGHENKVSRRFVGFMIITRTQLKLKNL